MTLWPWDVARTSLHNALVVVLVLAVNFNALHWVVVVVVVGNNLRVITLSPLLRGQHNQPTGNHSSSSYKHVSSYHHLISSYKHISSYHLISSYKHVSSYHHLISSSQNIGGKNHSRSIRCESRLVAVYQTNGESDLTKARLV